MSAAPLRPFEYMAAVLLLLGAWWYFSNVADVPPYLLPSPESTFSEIWRGAASGMLLSHLWFTFRNIVLGLILGGFSGVALAYLIFRIPVLGTVLDGPLVVFQTAPKIALAPLFVVWFGLGLTAKLVLIVSLVFFPVLVSALAGFRGIDSRIHDLSSILGLRPVQRFLEIDMVAALPGIFVGLKVGAIQALVGAILAEWISGDRGLGYLMTFASATYRTELLFSAVLLTSLLGILNHAALNRFERKFLACSESNG